MNARRVVTRLGEAECLDLLADGGMGRPVFTSRYGPTALPVMYKIDGESIVVGTWDPVLTRTCVPAHYIRVTPITIFGVSVRQA